MNSFPPFLPYLHAIIVYPKEARNFLDKKRRTIEPPWTMNPLKKHTHTYTSSRYAFRAARRGSPAHRNLQRKGKKVYTQSLSRRQVTGQVRWRRLISHSRDWIAKLLPRSSQVGRQQWEKHHREIREARIMPRARAGWIRP